MQEEKGRVTIAAKKEKPCEKIELPGNPRKKMKNPQKKGRKKKGPPAREIDMIEGADDPAPKREVKK